MKANYKLSVAKRIRTFLETYAEVNPNYEEGDNKYTSPDASELEAVTDLLENNITITRCFSDWSSGGYTPYTSEEGQKEHNTIMKIIKLIICEDK